MSYVLFNVTPDFGAGKEVSPSVNQIKFGDGYEQRAAKGLNTQPQKWSLNFSNRTLAEATVLDDFFAARAGVQAFEWTPPGGASLLLFVCRSWSKITVKNNLYTVSANFEQVYE